MSDLDLPRGTADYPDLAIVHFDGACQGPPERRIAGYGFVVHGLGAPHSDGGLALAPGSPEATNNVAEYFAAIAALEWLRDRGHRGAVIALGDSELVIRQMNGEYKVRSPKLAPYHEKLRTLSRGFAVVHYRHVPRAENEQADALSKQAVQRELRRLAVTRGARRPPDGPD